MSLIPQGNYGGETKQDKWLPGPPTKRIIVSSPISQSGDFPGGLVVKNPPSNAGGMGSIPGRGAKIPHATWCSQKKKIIIITTTT